MTLSRSQRSVFHARTLVRNVTHPGFPSTPKWTFLRPQNRSKTFKIVGVNAFSNEYTSKILDKDANIVMLFFGL